MKKLIALLIIAIAFIGSNSITTFSQPQITVHVTGGYDIPLPDLKGDYDTKADSGTYLMKRGFSFGADGKYYLGKKRNVGITFGLGYTMFSNNADTSTLLGLKNIKNKINAFTVGLGVEYAFMPKGKANPFVGAEFTGHFFSGDFSATFGTLSTTGTLKSASRFGLALGAGVDVQLNKNIGFIVGGKYNMANLIGKDSTSSTVTNEYTLNDKSTATTSAKNINYLQFYAGVSFYFNRPKIKK